MEADTVFGSQARSVMRLSTGLMLSLGLIFLLLVINFWATVPSLESGRKKADSQFSHVMENVPEEENILEAVSRRLAAHTQQLESVPTRSRPLPAVY